MLPHKHARRYARSAKCLRLRSATGTGRAPARGRQVLSCEALAGNTDVLLPTWSTPAAPALARAVCVLDGPLQDGESQVHSPLQCYVHACVSACKPTLSAMQTHV